MHVLGLLLRIRGLACILKFSDPLPRPILPSTSSVTANPFPIFKWFRSFQTFVEGYGGPAGYQSEPHIYRGTYGNNQLVLMNILLTRGVLGQGACLDALIAIMLDSSANQADFEACNGIEEVAILIRDKQVDEILSSSVENFCFSWTCKWGGERPPMATIHEDIRRFLGAICIIDMGS
ncbi:impaired sucrose induction [Datura stramonium]|uniref:Impaired sucrose induction n=1 Tax=Datura stramonium TaxID=4076 RepID=A0ABS8RSQ6_DATST|nr:impaired sucrose induction [Datura stramonium]